ncbi:hypothetical protein J7L06_05255 [Candidatus Bathyarchaeota archaeon]|nr:hypothetical protein [Candidatus Bathyarchaeota archaeon]
MKVLTSRYLAVRAASLWLIGFILLYTAWSLSYVSLPEGSARGTVIAAYVPLTTQEVNSTFIRIFTYNLLVAATSIFIANFIKVKGLPLGYFPLFYHWILYGVFLGTNSFMIPSATKLLPSLTTLFHGSGLYEITSYTLIAAATYNIGVPVESLTEIESQNGITSFLKGLNSRINRSEKAALLAAVILLMVSNYLEAWQIFHG